MPELPDIVTYLEALDERVLDRDLTSIRLKSVFVLRTVDPPISAAAGRRVRGIERIGKRIVFALDRDLFLVIHLMIAGRLHWKPPKASLSAKINLAALDFGDGTLVFTEAGSKRRASMHFVEGRPALAQFERGGIDPRSASLELFRDRLRMENHTVKRSLTDPRLFDGIGNAYSDEILHAARLSPLVLTSRLTDDEIERLHRATRETLERFRDRLRLENHTVKRSLTDPRLFDGIGNAYSDEILHAARLSPLVLTSRLTDDEIERLHRATRETLELWIDLLRKDRAGRFPEKVTAFRPEMAVHGKFGKPCPVCETPVQRIRYADNETNYCARCQTGGRLLADRAMSRLLKSDWPRSIDEVD